MQHVFNKSGKPTCIGPIKNKFKKALQIRKVERNGDSFMIPSLMEVNIPLSVSFCSGIVNCIFERVWPRQSVIKS